jgi:cell division protein FtsW (lipid II flippase)
MPDQSPQPPILHYHKPLPSGFRFGMPIWGQFAFGVIYALATPLLAVLLGVIHEGVGLIITILAFLAAIYVVARWHWRGFFSGILIAMCAMLILASARNPGIMPRAFFLHGLSPCVDSFFKGSPDPQLRSHSRRSCSPAPSTASRRRVVVARADLVLPLDRRDYLLYGDDTWILTPGEDPGGC